MTSRLRLALLALCALGAFALHAPAWSDWNGSAPAMVAGKWFIAGSFRGGQGVVASRELTLPALEGGEIAKVKAANGLAGNKRLQIGVARGVEATSIAAAWSRVEGGRVAHFRVVSSQAQALRLGLDISLLPAGAEFRFSGVADPTVYGPFSLGDVGRLDETYWSPVLTGEAGVVEIFVPESVSTEAVDVSLVEVSHLFVHPADPRAEMLAKDGSQSCEIDLICRAAADPVLASIGKSVARMSFVSGGGSFLCTGTLINPSGAQMPYFYSANHCISTQTVASTLTTHWFYDRAGCGTGSTSSSYVQLPGGATYLFSNAASDSLLLRLNASPPAGAVYAAWDSAALASGNAVTAVHHPAGDWKKVSYGNSAGFVGPVPGGPSGSFIRVNWTEAVTEQGSSGSGIFTLAGGEYRLRGGLYGGPSSCSAAASDKYDYYSRFDQAYSSISQYLSPTVVTFGLGVSKTGNGSGTVTSSPSGIACGSACSAAFASGISVLLSATPANGSTFSGWAGACSGTGNCSVTMDAAKTVSATFAVNQPPSLEVSSASLDFGPQLLSTTSFAKTVTVGNNGGGIVMVSAVGVTTGFGLSHDCVLISGGATCTIRVTFAPSSEVSTSGTLTITTDLGTRTVSLAGRGQASLVAHYYQSILRRSGDKAGLAYWDAEAVRLSGLGANINEAWFAMALSFYSSAEYVAFNRSNDGFVTDLYTTFFNRTPDAAGLAYWVGQIQQGLPREVALAAFMFSPEFAAFTQNLYGNTAARAEVDTAMDFYRGLLSRLPDSNGFGYWVQQFRTAQCQGGSAVNLVVEQISAAFAGSAEYLGRNRTNSQYVSDLYNAFLRRGGDLAGVQFWIAQLDTGARTRSQLRQSFLSSGEFQARVSAVIAQGCIP